MIAPEKSELLRPSVVMRPSGVAPMKPVTTGTRPSSSKRKKNGAAALSGFFQMRFGVAKGVASEDEIGGRNRNSGDPGVFESCSEETRAETFAKGGEAIGEFRSGSDSTVQRHFVKKIAAEKLEAAADTVVLLFTEMKILKHIEVEMDDALGFVARVGKLSVGERARDGEQTIGDPFHRGDNDDDVRGLRSRADEACGVQHALGA